MPNSEADREHKRRQRHRQQERRRLALDELLARIPLELDSIADVYRPIPSLTVDFWRQVPAMCNPHTAVMDSDMAALDSRKLARDQRFQTKLQHKLQARQERGVITTEEQEELWKQHGKSSSLLSASRGQRKAWQVENFVSLLQNYLLPGMTVVDFGSGTGNLCLSLAAYFPLVKFVLVDKNEYSLQLVQRRAEASMLPNVQVQQYLFSQENLKEYRAPNHPESASGRSFDLGIGLHCCGSFTDMVMEMCRQQRADCIVCPCCNGGLTSCFEYPRSTFLKKCMTSEEYLIQLSKSADDLQHYAAKCWIEYDRALWAQEQGMEVELWKLMPTECTPKHHVLYLKHKYQ